MKKFLLSTVSMLLLLASAFAQTTVTISSGTVTVSPGNPAITSTGVTDVMYIADRSVGTISLRNKYNKAEIYLSPDKPANIINGTTSTAFTTIDDVVAYFVAGGIGTQPAGGGGGGGGGGDASAANQVIGNTQLTQINSKTPALGQTTMSASQPVVIASNQTGVPVTGSFYQTTQPVSLASVPLATGAATAPNQATQITAEQAVQASTASIDTKTSILITNTTKQQAVYSALSISLTTTLTALPTAAGVLVEIKNNAVGAVDINVSKSGGAVEVIPAGAVSRFDGITNSNQLTISASTGTPTVFYRLYTQLMQ